MTDEAENMLDDFDLQKRQHALTELVESVRGGETVFPPITRKVNLHSHTFFSYSCYGYSPSHLAWLAKKTGIAVAGIIDFDVLDGKTEFLSASRLLGLKACVGMETRVFFPEFAFRVINSPGEPGITYHAGIGFPDAGLSQTAELFLGRLKKTAQDRNRAVMERVNRYLDPVKLDYQQDVLALTPAENPTERHICLAFAQKARKMFPNDGDLARFWSQKLGQAVKSIDLPEGMGLLNLIRSKTMKKGGEGYIKPDAGDFPNLHETNEFFLSCGAIPVLTWLDGTSEGEQDIENLLFAAMKTGVAAINIIPDRNYITGVKDQRLENLYKIIELAKTMHLPIVVGTEMNSPGQKIVDDFESPELAPFVDVFLEGAHIVYAHSVLQTYCGIGYCSDWAKTHFPHLPDRNNFYCHIGSTLKPENELKLAGLSKSIKPADILKLIRN